MKKTNRKIVSVIAVLTAMMLLFCSCGASASMSYTSGGGMKNDSMPVEAPAAAMEAAYDNGWYDYSMAEEAPMPEPTEGGYALESSSVKDKNVKLIYRANMSVQTLDYSETEKSIYELVEKFGGYLENVSKNNGSYYSSGNYVSGDFTVRVPAEHYTAFINTIGNSCHVVNLNQSVEDVSLQYSDAEGRLETLKVKYDRLLDLLSKADNMSDIIELEDAIAECEYQIDNFTSVLKRYDSLIGYSTIYLYVEQVSRLADSVEEDNSFGARLGRTLKKGLDNFLDSLDDFVMWLSYNLIGLIIFAIVVIFAVKLIRKWRTRNPREPRQKKQKKLRRRGKKAKEESYQGIPEEITPEQDHSAE